MQASHPRHGRGAGSATAPTALSSPTWFKDGPAAKAGLKSGDVVVGYNDQPIKGTHELALAVANTQPGQTVADQDPAR